MELQGIIDSHIHKAHCFIAIGLSRKVHVNYPYFFSMKRLALATLAIILSQQATPLAFAATLTWTGLGTDNNWTTAANWSSNTVPTSSDTILFNGTGKKNSILDNASAFSGSIAGLKLTSANTGSFLLNRNLSINGPVFLSGGTLDMRGSGTTLTVNGSWINGGGTFQAGTGTVALTGTGATSLFKPASAFNNLQIGNGLVGYWKFDETSGTAVADSSGNGNTGTPTNGPTISTDVPSVSFSDTRSLSFDGVNDYVNAGNGASLNLNSALTISAWIKTNNAGINAEKIVVKGDSIGTTGAYVLDLTGTNRYLRCYVENISSGLIGTQSLNDNQWHYVICKRDSSNKWTLYVDGMIQAALISGAAPLVTSATLGIGAYNDGQRPFSGNIDDVRLYNRALSASEISLLAQGFPGNQNQGNYILGSALTINRNLTNNSTFDVSPSNYALTLSGNLLNQGTFVPRAGTVTLSGTNQTLTGSTTFWNLTKTVSAPSTLRLNKGDVFSVSGALTLQGTAGNLLSLQSTNATTRASLRLDSASTQSLQYLYVNRIDSTGEQVLACGATCVNNGGNINWTFGGSQTLSGTAYNDAGITPLAAGKTVALSFSGSTYLATTNSSGQFTLPNLIYTQNLPLTLYLSGNIEKGALILLPTSSSLSGINLYRNTVIVRSSTTAPVRASHLATGSLVSTDVSTLIPTASPSTVTTSSAAHFLVWTGTTYGSGALTVGGNLTVNGTLSMGRQFLTVGGNVDASTGTLTSGSGLFLVSPSNQSFNPGASASLTNLAVTDGLVGYWKLDETSSGSTVIDSSGYGNNGTPNGAAGSNKDPQPSASIPPVSFADARSYSFDGTDDYVDLGSNTLTTGAWTESVWFYGTTFSGAKAISELKLGAIGVVMQIQPDGGIGLFPRGNGYALTAAGVASTNTWTHLTFTYNGNGVGTYTNYSIYVNGVLTASPNTAFTGGAFVANYIGKQSGGNWNGNIDDVRLYNRALSPSEITRLYQGSLRAGSGTLSLASNLSLAGNLSIATAALSLNGKNLTVPGTLTNNGLLLLQGAETVTTGTLLNNSGSEIRYTGSSSYSSLPLGNTYYDLSFFGTGTFSPSAGLLITHNLSLSGSLLKIQRKSLTITNALQNSGTLLLNGNEALSYGSLLTKAGAVIYTGSGTSSSLPLGNEYGALTLSGTGIWNLSSPLTIHGPLTLLSSTLRAPPTITLSGNWTNKGTFLSNGSLVTLNGQNQTLSGSTTFSSLTKAPTVADTLSIAAGTTQTLTTLTLHGASPCALLSLRSTIPGTLYTLSPTNASLTFLDLQDSYNATQTLLNVSGKDSGNNRGAQGTSWLITPTTCTLSTPAPILTSNNTGGSGGGGGGTRAQNTASKSSLPTNSRSNSSSPRVSLIEIRRAKRQQKLGLAVTSQSSAVGQTRLSTQAPSSPNYQVTSTVNLRSDARQTSVVRAVLRKGQTVLLLRTVAGIWAEVLLPDGRRGFVAINHLKKQ